MMVAADNMEARGRYDVARDVYNNTKINCMRGNGWIKETEENFNKKYPPQDAKVEISNSANTLDNLNCLVQPQDLPPSFYTDLKSKYNYDEEDYLFVNNEIIKEIFKAHIPELAECYQCYLNNSPEKEKFAGKFMANITYSSLNGIVEESSITVPGPDQNANPPEALNKCLNNVISGMKFTKLQKSKKISASFSLNFKPIKKP